MSAAAARPSWCARTGGSEGRAGRREQGARNTRASVWFAAACSAQRQTVRGLFCVQGSEQGSEHRAVSPRPADPAAPLHRRAGPRALPPAEVFPQGAAAPGARAGEEVQR